MKLAQLGLTLVELIVVITILAVLSAAAIPRYANLQVESRKAVVSGLSGSIRSAAHQAHIAWIVGDKPATIDMEGQTISILNGYPDQASIDDALIDYSGFQYVNLITARFTKIDAPTPATCMVSYTNATPVTEPLIVVLTAGC